MKKLAFAISILAASSISATAADMAVKARPMAIDPAYNWSGFYVGGHLGGAFADVDYLHTNTGGVLDPYDQKPSSFAGGGHIGLQYQWTNIVAGVEGSWTGMDLNETTLAPFSPDRSNSVGIRSLATVVGRVGIAWDKWMVYGKGGWATADTSFRRFITSTNATTASSSGWDDGWTAGVGIEHALLQNLILGFEYNYARINIANRNQTLAPGFAGTDTITNAHLDLHLVMARLTYKFGWGGAVAPRY